MCVIVAVPSRLSASAAALTVTACGRYQSLAVNLSVAPPVTVMSSSPVRDAVTVTVAVGSDSSTSVYVAVSPSGTSTRLRLAKRPRLSSSTIVRVAASTVSPVTVPDTVTDSSPSSKSSCVGVMVNVPLAVVAPAEISNVNPPEVP